MASYQIMKSNIYSNKILIGTSDLQITDESMGVVSGIFIPNENYNSIKENVWRFHSSKSNDNYSILERLRLNTQLENGLFLNPMGGFLITDIEELPNEEIEFEIVGNFRHILEDNFITQTAKEQIFEPWEYISIEQKVAFENEINKEIGRTKKKSWIRLFSNPKNKLNDYDFKAIAHSCTNDDVLFSITNKNTNRFDYAVVHLTWTSKQEHNDSFPRVEFFKSFAHFSNCRLYPDKADWEE